MEKYFQKSLLMILYLLLFIFPFFFLNFTQEYFVTNKLYLLSFGILLLVSISTIQILVLKKISWQKNSFDSLILFFLTTIVLSTLFSSPNKVQALLNPNFGLVMMISLVILYFYLTRVNTDGEIDLHRSAKSTFLKILSTSSVLLSLMTIIFYFQPFKIRQLADILPQSFVFLKNLTFTPVGSQLDLAILLGFFTIIGFTQVFRQIGTDNKPTKYLILNTFYLILNLLALFITVYSFVKPVARTPNMDASILLPPFRLSWYAAIETLKNPLTAIIGVGPDNFSAVFTRVKDFAYNQSTLWQINSFNVSRSAVLQIITETGIFGLLMFGLLIFSVFYKLISYPLHPVPYNLSFFYLLICLFFFPSSLIVWFLFFVTLAMINQSSPANLADSTDLTNMLPVYLGTIIIFFGLIGGAGYFLSRSYMSEYYFKKSLEKISDNNLKGVYDNQRQAVILNPYIEKFRSNFAQTNLIIANNLSSKIKDNKLSEQDRQTITQAIQAGIAESKATVSLNPQKAGNWQSLATIYSSIINVAQGADVWTISAYQRAILADPQNPAYRVGLGGVYYSQKKYDDALRFFEQAISLKPDWSNANYNYAWALFQKENYSQAVNAMQNTLNLLDPKQNEVDFEKVQKELKEFKERLSKEEIFIDDPNQQTEIGDLNLPTPPAVQISPKLELPKEASPEAK